MSKYICANCNHDFKIKSHYESHIYKKKKPCLLPIISIPNNAKKDENLLEIAKNNQNFKIIENLCNYCNKLFYDKYKLIRHHTTCKKKKEFDIKNEEKQKDSAEIQNKLINKIAELEQKINILESKTTKTTKSSKLSKITKNNSTNIIINNSGTINNNINIANFGTLDNKKIGNNIFYNTLTNYSGLKIMLKFIEHVHLNDKLKEYQNVEITDLGRNLGKIFTNNKWKIEDANEITDKIIDEGYDYYEIKFDELEDEIEEKPHRDKQKIQRNKRFIFIMKGNEMFNTNDDGDYVDDTGEKITELDFKNGRKFEEKLKKKVKMLLKK